ELPESVERLRQVETSLGRLRIAQQRDVRIRGRLEKPETARDDEHRSQEEWKARHQRRWNNEQRPRGEEPEPAQNRELVATPADDSGGRHGHQEIGAEVRRLQPRRPRSRDVERLLKVLVEHVEKAVRQTPEKKEAGDE